MPGFKPTSHPFPAPGPGSGASVLSDIILNLGAAGIVYPQLRPLAEQSEDSADGGTSTLEAPREVGSVPTSVLLCLKTEPPGKVKERASTAQVGVIAAAGSNAALGGGRIWASKVPRGTL